LVSSFFIHTSYFLLIMPFDSSKPANGAPILSTELRDQFNALKALIDAQQTQITALQAAVAQRAPRVDGVSDTLLAINDPPQQAEVVALAEKLVELIDALQQT
jgi:hypothetical protein